MLTKNPTTLKWTAGLVLLLWTFVLPAHGAAQDANFITETSVSYVFGESITFETVLSGDFEPDALFLNVRLPGSDQFQEQAMEPAENGSWEYVHLVSEQFVRAFAEGEYFFRSTGPDGAPLESDVYVFHYSDNRFAWKTLDEAPFRLNWYAGDAEFARSVLDAGLTGLARAGSLLETNLSGTIDIYLYADLEDYRFSQGQLGQAWAGGHADPSEQLVILSLPPGQEQQTEIERKIPHEIAHIMLYQRTGAGYWNVPVWLNEGLASLIETFPNPDYEALLQSNPAENLLPLESLCEAFPQSASGALMAYAEANAFVRYLENTFGPAGVRALIDSYAGGAGCPTGSRVPPVEMSLAELEAAWMARRASGEALQENSGLAPWLGIALATLAAPLVLLGVLFIRRKS